VDFRSKWSTSCASGVRTDRAQFFKDLSAPFYGANRPGANVSQGLRDSFWMQAMLCGLNAVYDCIKISVKILKNARLEVYRGQPHGICSTQKDRVNTDLLAFVETKSSRAAA
jgi:non-heme chloroperoxidase